MPAIDPNAQYSIHGTPVRVDRIEDGLLLLHAPLRLCPGRTVSLRTGATTLQATVLNAAVIALHGEQGTTYEIQATVTGGAVAARRNESDSTASPACLAEAPEERRLASLDPASEKGGRYRAA